MDGLKENRAAIINEEGWEEWLLELLLDGSPCIPTADEQVSFHHFLLQSVDHYSHWQILSEAQIGSMAQCSLVLFPKCRVQG